MVTLEIKSDIEDIETIIRSAINAGIKRLEIGLNKTDKEIRKFEDKYKISSDIFIKEYSAEDLDGGDDEYISWMGEIKIKEKINEELNKLKEIEYVTE
ncbi:MAG: hypothetical protein GY749_17805 [Desulfobacteraceae bacterium]|nr:hypothetical protein [Desulfobacteraceae bacterium]MCP4352628.1 hypothetical protein [Desulfobacterales bacterium]